MQLQHLRQFLADNEDLSDETEVRLIHQPNYPLQCGLANEPVIVGCDEERIDELEESLVGDNLTAVERGQVNQELGQLLTDGNQTSVVYLAEGSSLGNDVSPYGDSTAMKKLGWR